LPLVGVKSQVVSLAEILLQSLEEVFTFNLLYSAFSKIFLEVKCITVQQKESLFPSTFMGISILVNK
jgi:hypothetical protein